MPEFAGAPVAVLVDDGTASSGEGVALADPAGEAPVQAALAWLGAQPLCSAAS